MEKQNIDYAKEIKRLKDAIRRLNNKCKDYALTIQNLEETLVKINSFKNSSEHKERTKYLEVYADYAIAKADLINTQTLIRFKEDQIKELQNQELQENMPQPE